MQTKEYVIREYVCASCVEDYAIRDFIKRNAQSNICDYCDTEAEVPIAAAMAEIAEFVANGIRCEYCDPGDVAAPWDSEESKWALGEVYSSSELAYMQLEHEPHDEVREDLIKFVSGDLGDQEWCHENYVLGPLGDAIFGSWKSFCEIVKHQARYTFFRSEINLPKYGDPHEISLQRMLDEIHEHISNIDLYRILEVGELLIRVRLGEPGVVYHTAKELGAPPTEFAIFANRMSPAGIPMFYGAFDEQTAIAETRTDTSCAATASIAHFRLLRSANVLDLTSLRPIPSLFDDENRMLRESIRFLTNFRKNISKPVIKGNKAHIEYVPTQAFTEYMRYIATTVNGEPIQGIVYPSAVHCGGKSCVLFMRNEDCCDKTQNSTNAWLMLERVEHRNLN